MVTSAFYRDLVKEQLPAMKDEQIILEPMRRNTAPCVAYANERIALRDPDAMIVVAPSDHLVMKEAEFHETIRLAMKQAGQRRLPRHAGHRAHAGPTPATATSSSTRAMAPLHPRVKRVTHLHGKAGPRHGLALH